MKKTHAKKKFTCKKLLRILLVLAVLGVCGLIFLLSVNAYVKGSVKDRILSPEEAAQLEDVDCILILGCGVEDDGRPSDMLRDRLTRGLELYGAGAAPKLLMSGDHGRTYYNEVGVMKSYAVENGVPSSAVFMDHAGFSTYDTMYRAKEIFAVKKVVIVTQGYHLYRSLYLAQKFGMDAYGVASDYHTYRSQWKKDAREVLARCKDWAKVMGKPKPTYLGEKIPIGSSGTLTDD